MTGVIDVGSNSVRLAVFDGDREVFSDLSTTRLGSGLADGNKLKAKDIANTVSAISCFVKRCAQNGITPHIFGTAACREATNAKELLFKVKAETGIDVHVLSGSEEACIAYVGGSVLAENFPCLVVDIGGASTEIAIGNKKSLMFAKSHPVGAVKLFTACGENKEKAKELIDGCFSSLLKIDVKSAIAIGGSATSVAAILSGSKKYDKKITHGFAIEKAALSKLTERLFESSLIERKALSCIDEKRAEIIPFGALILESVMERLGIEKILSSEADNLFGYMKVFTE